MQYLHIAGYKFISLNSSDLSYLHDVFSLQCKNNALKGTILLSTEGINLTLAGTTNDIGNFINYLKNISKFSDMEFRKSYSTKIPFKRLKIKIKNEIITFKQTDIDVTNNRAPMITPETLKHWLDENKELTLLDTRNDYEIEHGTFKNAASLNLSDFSQLPEKIHHIEKNKTIVMFCTGGIRCEKAALYMQKSGYQDVYQLDGGILNYFAKVGGAHYEGNCFVFDDRVSVDSSLSEN